MSISKKVEFTMYDGMNYLTLSTIPFIGGMRIEISEPARGHGPGETEGKILSFTLSKEDILKLAEEIDEAGL